MFKIDASGFLRSLETIERLVLDAARIGVGEAARVAFRSAKDTTLFRDRTGKLRGSLEVVDTGTYSKRLIARAEHGVYVNEGTRPHEIVPRKGKMLRFVVAGSVVFAKKVNHPGTAKRPFMDNAAAAGSQAMRLVIDERVEDAVKSS